ncbi:MAG TPA: LuxR C-terminal-related transcriptional regulator, partial [Candidatus Limnocylindrales bacterium]
AHGEPPAGESLPVPADIRDLLRERLAALPDGTREVLLDLAVVGTVDPDRLAAMHGVDVGGDLERAIADALVRRDGRSISFAHPLYAAAAEAAATPEQRRAAHERAARTAADVEEEARHRALATEGPDAAVAAALEAAARGGRSRAAPLAAAELLRLSIERTPPAEVEAVARRRVALGEVLKQAGDAPAAIRELELVVAEADAAARAEARLVLAAIRFETDASPAAAVRLAAAAVEDAGGDPAIAAHAYAVLTAVDWQEIGRHAEYLDAAEAAIAKVAEPDPAVEGLIVLARCGEDVRTGHPLNPGLVARGLELEELAPAPAVADRFSGSYGTWLKLLGRFDEARVWLERTRQAAIDEGDEGSLAYSLSHLPELEVWTGDWDRAEVIAREHLAVSEASNLESQRLQALYNLALVHVHQGRADARAELDAAIAAATEADDRWMLSGILPILGLLELSLGDAAAAVDPFERAYEIREQLGSDEPRRFGPDLVEALIAVGRIDRAEAVQRELEARIARFDRPSSRATVARSRALLLAAHGRLEEARDALDEALGQHAVALIPFDRARTLLALGQVRRRLRERGAARDAFEEARAELERLGSLPWAARAAAELERTGIRRGAGLDLTETERRVAELAASGLTNREVAAALFMSPKTVDANLGRAYAKLGIRSRAELGAVIARRDAGGSGAQT